MNVKDIEFGKQASFRLSEELLAATNRECRNMGIDRSALLRSLLEKWLQEQKRSTRLNVIQIENSIAA